MVEAMEVKKGYKKSDVGIIPVDWEVIKLSEVGESIIGLTYSPYNVKPYGKLVLRSSNVQDGKLAFKDNVYVEMDFPSRVIVKENDILICVRNGSRRLIGKCALIDKKTAGSAFGAFMSVYRSEYSTFIFHQFQSFIIQWQINETLGATINQITNKDLATFRVPLPPTKEEQANIIKVLNDADALINQIEQLLTKKRNIKTGAMQELLKPKEGWEEKTLGEVATLKARIGWQGLTTAEYRKTGNYFLITGTEFKNGFIDWESCFYVDEERYKQDKNIQVKEHDVLVTKDGTIGKIALVETVPQPATLNSGVFVIRPIANSFHPEFFYYLLLSEVFSIFLSQLSAGSTISHLYQKDFVTFKFLQPKTIDEQKEIAKILFDMDTEIQELERKLVKYKMIKQGMMQSLLTGKIRLV